MELRNYTVRRAYTSYNIELRNYTIRHAYTV